MKRIFFLTLIVFSTSLNLFSQRVGFFSSQIIREKYPDARLASQRCQTMVDEWKRELKSMEDREESLIFDAKKNRLIWSDVEKATKEKDISDLQIKRQKYADEKYSPNGEYDRIVFEIMKPVEEKIFAAVQEVASKEKYDFILDQSTQPLAYVNFKYDITLKVLKVLGVDVTVEEKEQEQKITQDPRNDDSKKNESQSQRRKSRTATKTPAQTDDSSINKLKPDDIIDRNDKK
jgi:outer membrane protein